MGIWKLLTSVDYTQAAGLVETHVMEVPVGCLVRVTTSQQGTTSFAMCLVPGVEIFQDREANNYLGLPPNGRLK